MIKHKPIRKSLIMMLSFLMVFGMMNFLPGPQTPVAQAADSDWPAAALVSYSMPFRPENSLVTTQNPPDFSWPFVAGADSYTLQVSRKADMTDVVHENSSLTRNFYNFPQVFESGIWYWRVSYHKADGSTAWSTVRKFRIEEVNVSFEVPSVEEMMEDVSDVHPRIWTTPDTLAQFSSLKDTTGKDKYEFTLSNATEILNNELPKEPVFPYNDDNPAPDATDYKKAQDALKAEADAALNQMTNTAFIYLVSEDPDIRAAVGAKARQLLLSIASWDPEGSTSFEIQDQVHRAIAYKSAMVYDWIYDLLSDDDKATVKAMVKQRVETMIDKYLITKPMYQFPYDSHGWTILGYIGIIATAMLHDMPEAEDWFRESVPVYINLLPPWGGENGSWSQGTGYWQWSSAANKELMDVLLSAGAIDLYRKSFSRNEGDYPLYMFPHGTPKGVFGDATEYAPGGASVSMLNRISQMTQNPRLKWESEAIGVAPNTGLQDYFYGDADLDSRPPVDLPNARWFADTGFVAMHSDLSDKDRVSLYFRSNSYGTAIHNQADQNAFIINAYGESLAPKSGFYDYYGTPHHYDFTRQTFSANAITFDGKRGQPVEDFSADGQILGFVTSPDFDATSGDATAAYKGALSKAVRHILYLRPDMFVVIDDLATSKSGGSNFEWNLHGEDNVTIDADGQGATVAKGKANLNVQFYTAQPMTTTYTTKFLSANGTEVPPDPKSVFANEVQAHAQFITPKTNATKIITTMEVYETGEEAHEVVSDQQSNYTKLIFADDNGDDTIIYVRTSNDGLISTNDNIQFDGAAVAVKGDSVLLVNGAKVVKDGVTLIESDKSVTVAYGDEQLSVSGLSDAEIALYAPDVTRLRDLDTGADIPSGGVIADAMNQRGVHWTPAGTDNKLTLHVESGQQAFKLNDATMPGPAAPVVLQTEIDGEPGEDVTLQTWTDINGENVSWGNLVNDGGFYEVEEAPAGFSFAKYGHSETAILDANTPIILRGDTGVLKLRSFGAGDPTAADLSETPDSDRDTLSMDWQEAENFAEWGGGKAPNVYDTRKFLSGGKGVNNWDQTGMSMKWNFNVPKAGTYDLYIKYVTGWDLPAGTEQSTRYLQIGDEVTYFQAPKTEDFGTRPDIWRGLRVKTGVQLPAGPVDVTMWHQLGGLNLDWLALIEVKDDEIRPSKPTLQLDAQAATSVDLSWTESTDPEIQGVTTGVKEYVVYANGEEKAVIPVGTTTATVSGLTRGETYTFAVKARDMNDNLSVPSNSVIVALQEMTAPVWDDTASIRLDRLFPGTARLSWDRATVNEGNVTYTIYKLVGATYEPIATRTEASHDVSGLQPGETYSFKVEASNDEGTFAVGGPAISITMPMPVSGDLTFFESFDDLPAGEWSGSPDWVFNKTGNSSVQIVDLPGLGGKGMKMIDDYNIAGNEWATSLTAQRSINTWPYLNGGKVTAETRFKFTKLDHDVDTIDVNVQGRWTTIGRFRIYSDGKFGYSQPGTDSIRVMPNHPFAFAENEWVTVRFDMDLDAQTIDLSVQADSLKSYSGTVVAGSTLDTETGTVRVPGIPFLLKQDSGGTAIHQTEGIYMYQQYGTGAYTFDYLTFYRTDDTPQNSTINLTKANFDKNAASAVYGDVSTTLTLNGNTLTRIVNDGEALVAGTDYTIEGSTATIKKEYLAAQSEGVVPLTFIFSEGVTQTLAITVFDTSLPNGSINLVVNGSYEMDTASPPSGWSVYSAQSPDTYTVGVDEAEHKNGVKSLKISVQSGTSVTVYQAANITGDKSYKYSTWVKKQDSASTARLSYSFRNAANEVITPPGFVNLSPLPTAVEDENGWVPIEVVVTAPPESAVLVIGNFATAGTTWYDDVQLVEWNSVTSLSLDKTEETIAIGDTLQIHATVLPSNATNPAVVWTSSNPEVAVVDQEGNVTAIKGGTAIITAKTEENGFEQQCIVQVSSNSDITVENDSAQTQIGVPVSGQVAAVDANGHDLTYSLAVPAANGVVNVSSNGSWTYTPSIGFYGTDEFRVGVEDAYGNYTFSIITVTVESLADTLSGFADVHPRLYLDHDKIDQLQLAVQPGGTHASLWNEFKLLVDAQLAEAVPAYYADPSEEELWEREVANKTVNFAFAYLISGEEKYKDAAIEWALASSSYPTWGRSGDLTNASLAAGHQLFSLAIVYDWLYNELDAETKNTLLTALQAHGEEMYKKAAGLPFNGRTVKVFSGSAYLHNHMYISMGGLSAAAMAIFDEDSDAVDWFGYTMSAFGKTESLLADDGASHEGFPYWEYGTEWLIKYAKLAEKFVGSHMLQNEWFKNSSAYVAYSMLGENDWRYNSSFLNIGDNEGINYAGPDHILRVLAAENKDGLAQWMADQVAEKHLATRSAEWLGILYYDPTVEATPVSAEPTMHWFDNLDLVVSRTGWSGDESIVAFKSGPPQGHKELAFPGNFGGGHEHPDANHFLLYANGEYLIRDDGYADKLTSNHNTLLINGAGQIGEGSRWFDNGLSKTAGSEPSILKAVSEDGFDYMLGDAASAYPSSTGLTKYQRHLIFLKPDILIVVDDIATSSPQDLELRYFPESETIQTLPDGGYLLTSTNNTLRFQALATDGAAVSADKVAYKSDKFTGNRLALRVRGDDKDTLRTAVAFSWSGNTALPTEITLDQQGDVWKFEAGTKAVELNFATQSVTEVEGSGSAADMSDASLASLTINGKLLTGFSPEAYSYTHVYTDKKPVPVLSYVLNSAAASAEVDYDGAVPGVATLEVTAGDGTERTYTVYIEASGILPIYGATSNGTTGFNPDHAYDDKLDTYWSAKVDPALISEDNPAGYPSIVFDLNEVQSVNKIGINWYNGPGRHFVFDMEASNDAVNWTPIYSGESDSVSDGEEIYDVDDVQARYIRVIGHGTTTSVFFSIDEIYIYQPDVIKNNIISLTTEDTAKAAGAPFQLEIGAASLANPFTVMDVTISYDPARLAFELTGETGAEKLAAAAVEALRDGWQLVTSEVIPELGKIRLFLGATSEANAATASGPLFALKGTVKADAPLGAATVSLDEASGSMAGDSYAWQVTGATATITIAAVSKDELQSRIAAAQSAYNASVEGSAPGQYPASARAALLSAIQDANAVFVNGTATQAQVNAAVEALNTAISTFAAAVIPAEPVNREALDALIAAAQSRYDAAVEGTKVGQYAIGARAALQAAIQAATHAVLGTQAAADAAKATLQTALDTFTSKIVTLIPGATKVTIADLSLLVRFYGVTSSDADWEQVEAADLKGTGKIDIVTLAAVAQLILDDWRQQYQQ